MTCDEASPALRDYKNKTRIAIVPHEEGGEQVEYLVRCIWLRTFLCNRSTVAFGSAMDGVFVMTGRQRGCGSPARSSTRSYQVWICYAS